MQSFILHPLESMFFCFFSLKVLKYTAGHINYGGRVTDDWDRRCIMNILNDFYCPTVLAEEHAFSESGIYHQMNPDNTHKVHHHSY